MKYFRINNIYKSLGLAIDGNEKVKIEESNKSVSYTHLRAHET